MSTLYWETRKLTCAALEELVEATPAAERQRVTTLWLYRNELEELPGCLASFTDLTWYVKPLLAPPATCLTLFTASPWAATGCRLYPTGSAASPS